MNSDIDFQASFQGTMLGKMLFQKAYTWYYFPLKVNVSICLFIYSKKRSSVTCIHMGASWYECWHFPCLIYARHGLHIVTFNAVSFFVSCHLSSHLCCSYTKEIETNSKFGTLKILNIIVVWSFFTIQTSVIYTSVYLIFHLRTKDVRSRGRIRMWRWLAPILWYRWISIIPRFVSVFLFGSWNDIKTMEKMEAKQETNKNMRWKKAHTYIQAFKYELNFTKIRLLSIEEISLKCGDFERFKNASWAKRLMKIAWMVMMMIPFV